MQCFTSLTGCCLQCVVSSADVLDRITASRRLGSLLRSLVLVLVLGHVVVYFSWVTMELQRLYGISGALLVTIVGIIILANLLTSFFATFLIGPGFSQKASRKQRETWETLGSNGVLYDEEGNECRLCSRCHAVRIIGSRTHHCSACNACVLQMDHHCPWLNCCIGKRNRVYFINFLLWLLLGCIFASLSEWIAFKHRRNFGEFFRPIVKILFLIALGTVIPLFLFLLWNLILIWCEETTVDLYVKSRRGNTGNITLRGILNSKGLLNFEQIFGPFENFYMWFIPVVRIAEDFQFGKVIQIRGRENLLYDKGAR